MKKVLSIQSAVTYGFVGNSVAAPVITKLGLQPLLVDTIALAAHPGYGITAGGIPDNANFSAILEAFLPLGILTNLASVITGYLGDVGQIAPIEHMLRTWRKTAENSLYILDPVLGDGNRLYVDTAIVSAMQNQLLPLANIVTPNQFELGLLTNQKIYSSDHAINAAKILLNQNPLLRAVVATGISNSNGGISDISVSRKAQKQLDYPKRTHGVAGGGDLLTAILSCWLSSGKDLNTAFIEASRNSHKIIDNSANAIEISLFDNLNCLTPCDS